MEDHSKKLSKEIANLVVDDIYIQTKYKRIKWKSNVLYNINHVSNKNLVIDKSYYSFYKGKKILLFKSLNSKPFLTILNYDSENDFINITSDRISDFFKYI